MVIAVLVQSIRQPVPQNFRELELTVVEGETGTCMRHMSHQNQRVTRAPVLCLLSGDLLNPPRCLLQGGFLLGGAT